MARTKTTKKPAGGRGSAEAVAKRRAARQLNTLLSGGKQPGDKLDGRTEKRRLRLVKELKDGRRGRPLKAIDFVTHVNELLEIGETLASLRKQGVKARKPEQTPELLDVARAAQKAYGFRADAWKMMGLDLAAEPKKKTRKGSRGKR